MKETPPFIDGTTGKLNDFLELFEHYLVRPGLEKASEAVLAGDGVPWIWERIPELIRETAGIVSAPNHRSCGALNSHKALVSDVINWKKLQIIAKDGPAHTSK